MNQYDKYNIILIEPSPVIQQGLKALLSIDPRFVITHTFSDIQSYDSALVRDNIQLILINPSVVSVHKQFSVKNLFPSHPNSLQIAIVYSYVDAETLSNFDGFIDIYSTGSQLIKKMLKIIDTATENETKTISDNVDLSNREKEILISIAIGLTNKEIAEKHNISVHTAISHRKNISRKIGIKTVSGLTIYAIFNGLISDIDIQ